MLFPMILFMVLLSLTIILSKSSEVEESVEGIPVESFQNKESLNDHIKKLSEKTNPYDKLPSEEELVEFRKEEMRIRLGMEEIINVYGRESAKFTEQLHKLGRSIYNQHRFDEVFKISNEILELHENLDGPESANTARALGNVASAAFRLKKTTECEYAMNRALYIWIELYGPDSKEVLLHRGNMLTYQIPYAKTSSGLSYEDYLFEL